MESITEQIVGRLEIGKKRYGHGVIVDSDTREWGTPKNSWIDMAVEEFLDAIIYVIADYIRQGRESQKVDECKDHEPDDNKLIMHILKNHEKIESPKHRMLVWNLINILLCSTTTFHM